MTDEVASVEGNDNGMFARLNGFGDEDISFDGVAVDFLVGDVVDIKRGELVFDGCNYSRIHTDIRQLDLSLTMATGLRSSSQAWKA